MSDFVANRILIRLTLINLLINLINVINTLISLVLETFKFLFGVHDMKGRMRTVHGKHDFVLSNFYNI